MNNLISIGESMFREKYLDNVKGISILCIVLLHYVCGIFPDEFNVFVGSFMITAFYVVSGWLSAMKSTDLTLKQFAGKRFRQLGIPYLYWTIIILVFDTVLWLVGYYDSYYIIKEIYKAIVLRGIGTLWFLPALFVGGVIWHVLSNKSKWIILVALCLTIGYQCIYTQIFSQEDPVGMKILNAPFRAIYNMLQAWIGIAFGYYSYHWSVKYLNNRVSLFIVGLTLLAIAYITANYYPFDLAIGWHYLAPLIGPLGLIYLTKSMPQELNYLNYWGCNSLNLMVTHYSITLVLFKILVENVLEIRFYGWITLAAFLVSMPIQHLLVSFVNKYARCTLGKQ